MAKFMIRINLSVTVDNKICKIKSNIEIDRTHYSFSFVRIVCNQPRSLSKVVPNK